MTRSAQTTPAVSANCASSSSDSSTGQSAPGMSTPTRIARSGARESRVLDGFSSPAKGLNCSAIDSSNSLFYLGLVFLFYLYLAVPEPCETAHTCQQRGQIVWEMEAISKLECGESRLQAWFRFFSIRSQQ